MVGKIQHSNSAQNNNINAGFDEVSSLLQTKFNNAEITTCDFFDPLKHTEVSLQRARKAYPPNPHSLAVKTEQLPFASETFDLSLAILSAHEIRNREERLYFFRELNRVTKSSGTILLTEHLRDWSNFLAYSIGFFHFHSRATWMKTFNEAGLAVKQEIKTTPFITTFILEKNGSSF